jgi:hypothetical protein
MPLSDRVYLFPGLPERTFHGLPGMLADLHDNHGPTCLRTFQKVSVRFLASFRAPRR